MIPRGAILLQLALIGVLLSAHFFTVVNVPRLRGDIDLALEPVAPEPLRLNATVTAYSSSPDETSGDPFITASGRRVFDGLVACPRILPFGTKVRIDDRTYQCYDRLHQKYDHRFDIWMSTKNAALGFGKQQLPVEVIGG